MHALVRTGSLIALLSAAALFVMPRHGDNVQNRKVQRVNSAAANASPPAASVAPCPRGSLPDDGTCIPVPKAPATATQTEGDEPMIQLRPDRIPQTDAYLWPSSVPPRSDPGRGMVALDVTVGALIRVATLDGQPQPAQVLSRARDSVLLLHPGTKPQVLSRYSGLQPIAAVKVGAMLDAGALLGHARAAAVHFEIRRMRATAPNSDAGSISRPPHKLPLSRSVRIDPRNVLLPVAPPSP